MVECAILNSTMAKVTINQNIQVSQEKIKEICQKYHIRRLAFFGSVLRGDFSAKSDVDVLVEFAPNHTPGFFTFSRIAEEFSKILGGRQVDLRTPQDLSQYFRNEVVKNAYPLYGTS